MLLIAISGCATSPPPVTVDASQIPEGLNCYPGAGKNGCVWRMRSTVEQVLTDALAERLPRAGYQARFELLAIDAWRRNMTYRFILRDPEGRVRVYAVERLELPYESHPLSYWNAPARNLPDGEFMELLFHAAHRLAALAHEI
ncbi:MAG TPA: hypothetical protein VFF06_28430 [Polyangia bacterium]|nr:hypothetical protein [Polyangia bacterium]